MYQDLAQIATANNEGRPMRDLCMHTYVCGLCVCVPTIPPVVD